MTAVKESNFSSYSMRVGKKEKELTGSREEIEKIDVENFVVTFVFVG